MENSFEAVQIVNNRFTNFVAAYNDLLRKMEKLKRLRPLSKTVEESFLSCLNSIKMQMTKEQRNEVGSNQEI